MSSTVRTVVVIRFDCVEGACLEMPQANRKMDLSRFADGSWHSEQCFSGE